MLLVFTVSTVLFNNFNVGKLAYEESISSSFPVDEYGLIDVNGTSAKKIAYEESVTKTFPVEMSMDCWIPNNDNRKLY